MTQFNFSKFTPDAFEQLGRDLLNASKGLSLVEPNVKDIKSGPVPDFWQQDLTGNILAIAEIKSNKKLNYTDINTIKNYVSSWTTGLRPQKLFLLFFADLESEIATDLDSFLETEVKGPKFEVLDINWVEGTLGRFPKLIDKWTLLTKENLDSEFLNDADKERQKEDILELVNSILGSDNVIYAAGSTWKGFSTPDQTARFLSKGIWENNDEGGWGDKVNLIKKEDIIVLKSAFAKKTGVGIFRVKALGRVTNNHLNGRKIDVNWVYKADFVDFESNKTKIKPHSRRLSVLSKWEFIEILEGLDIKNLSELGLVKNLEIEIELEGNRLTRTTSITNDQNTIDALGFDRDAKSLAALITSNGMRPPLAIALFGRWGSGKSFFMELIERNVRELSKYQGFRKNKYDRMSDQANEKLFVEGVAHIKFNAWSYMDANLWAGLAHSLFEKLDEYIRDNTKGDIERLKVQLKIAKRLDFLNSKVNDSIDDIARFKKLQVELELQEKYHILKYFAPQYNEPFIKFMERNGFEEKTIKSLTPSELRGLVKKSINFFNYIKANGFHIASIIISIILVLLIIKEPVSDFINSNLVQDKTSRIFNFLASFWTKLSVLTSPFIIAFFNFLYKKRKALVKITSFLSDLADIKKKDQTDKQRAKLKRKLENLESLVDETKSEIIEIENDNREISDLAINNFIEHTANNNEYKKHTGIITTIRKDFETLSDLFVRRDLDKSTLNEKEKERVNELQEDREEIEKQFQGKANKKLERIVLYIDDLDRCRKEKVMEVLEAVHLLMAFPLFVVIVGVDERQIHNALRYRHIKQYKNLHNSFTDDLMQRRSPIDYLEKIFQIPFQLPETTPAGAANLIDLMVPSSQTIEEDIKEEFNKTDAKKIDNEDADTDNYLDIKVELNPKQKDYDSEKAAEIESIPPEEILITDFEKVYLKKCSVLIGSNPRTIKRFINIFKIAKVHQSDQSIDKLDRLRILFLIALYLGKYRGEIAPLMDSKTFSRIIDFTQPVDINQGISNLHASEKIKMHLSDELIEVLVGQLWKDELLRGILSLQISKMAHHLKFIKRFVYKLDSVKNF